jgi:hypothetical protein
VAGFVRDKDIEGKDRDIGFHRENMGKGMIGKGMIGTADMHIEEKK